MRSSRCSLSSVCLELVLLSACSSPPLRTSPASGTELVLDGEAAPRLNCGLDGMSSLKGFLFWFDVGAAASADAPLGCGRRSAMANNARSKFAVWAACCCHIPCRLWSKSCWFWAACRRSCSICAIIRLILSSTVRPAGICKGFTSKDNCGLAKRGEVLPSWWPCWETELCCIVLVCCFNCSNNGSCLTGDCSFAASTFLVGL